jgi:hypothetical protein
MTLARTYITLRGEREPGCHIPEDSSEAGEEERHGGGERFPGWVPRAPVPFERRP